MVRTSPLHRFAIVLVIFALVVPNAVAGWKTRGSYEPDTYEDAKSGMQHLGLPHSTNENTKQVYLNAFAAPPAGLPNPNVALLQTNAPGFATGFNALLGIWRDCNLDGYVGSAASAQYAYSSYELLDDAICNENKAHNDGDWVYEFLAIGPSCNLEQMRGQQRSCNDYPWVLEDDGSKVWGDNGLPKDPYPGACPSIFLPKGTLQTTGGMIRFGDCFLRSVPLWNTLRNDPTLREKSPCLDDNAADIPLIERDLCKFQNPTGSPGDDAAIVIRCTEMTYVDDPVHGGAWAVPGIDLDALLTSNPTNGISPSGTTHHTIGSCTDHTQEYDMYALVETERPNDGKKRFTDWEFVFYPGPGADPLETTFGNITDLNPTTLQKLTLSDTPIWLGTRTDPVWINPYLNVLSDHFEFPNRPWNFTFYAATPDARPGGAAPTSQYYVGPCAGVTAGIRDGWDCDSERWWTDGASWSPHRAKFGQEFNVRDVDCYDTTMFGVVLGRGAIVKCERPEPLLVTLLAGVDANGDCMGDRWQAEFALLDPVNDTDDDNAQNLQEFQWRTIPVETSYSPSINDLDLTGPYHSAQDFDGDGWWDGDEIAYWDGDNINCQNAEEVWNLPPGAFGNGVALYDEDSFSDVDGDGLANQHDRDADNDSLPDGLEVTFHSYPDEQDSDCPMERQANDTACRPALATAGMGDHMSSGDGLPDGDEYYAWKRVGELLGPEITGEKAVLWDIDGDGGYYARSNLLDPDSDGDGLLDGEEWRKWNGTTTPYENISAMHDFDTDGDGLLDGASIYLTSADSRWRLFLPTIVSCVQPPGRLFIGEVAVGTWPNQYDPEGSYELDCDVQRPSDIGNSLIYTAWKDRDIPLEHQAAFVREFLNGTAGSGTEIEGSARAAAHSCIDYVQYRALDNISTEQQPCPESIRAFVNQTLIRATEPTPLGPLVPEVLEIATETDWALTRLVGCVLPSGADALSLNVTEVVDCSLSTIVPYSRWLADRTVRIVERTLNTTIETLMAVPLVAQTTRQIAPVRDVLADPSSVAHTVNTILHDPQSLLTIAGNATEMITATSPESILELVANSLGGPDPSESFTESIFSSQGMSAYYDAFRQNGGGVVLDPVDSLYYGTWAKLGENPNATRRTLIENEDGAVLDLDGDEVSDIRVRFAIPQTPSGTNVKRSPEMTIERLNANANLAGDLTVVTYYRPANTPFVFTLGVYMPIGEIPGEARVSVIDFIASPLERRTVEVQHLTSNPLSKLLMEVGAFQVDDNGLAIPGHEVRVKAELTNSQSSTIRLARTGYSPQITSFSAETGLGSNARVGFKDIETIPGSPPTEVDVRMFTTFQPMEGAVSWTTSDGYDEKSWTWEGETPSLQVNHVEVIDKSTGTSRAAFQLTGVDVVDATSTTAQVGFSSSSAKHESTWITYLHGVGTTTCEQYRGVEYHVVSWQSAPSPRYCATGYLRGLSQAALRASGGGTIANFTGVASRTALLATNIADAEWSVALKAGANATTATATASATPIERGFLWTSERAANELMFASVDSGTSTSFASQVAPESAYASVLSDRILVEGSGALGDTSITFSATGAAVPSRGTPNEVYVEGAGSNINAHIRLENLTRLLATKVGNTFNAEGTLESNDPVLILLASEGAIQTAGSVTASPGSFNLKIADKSDGVDVNILPGTAVVSRLDIGVKLPIHSVDVHIVDNGFTQFAFAANTSTSTFHLAADETLDKATVKFSQSGQLPRFQTADFVLIGSNGAGAVSLSNISHAESRLTPNGIHFTSSPTAAQPAVVQLSQDSSVRELAYSQRPTDLSVEFNPNSTEVSGESVGADVRFTRMSNGGSDQIVMPLVQPFKVAVLDQGATVYAEATGPIPTVRIEHVNGDGTAWAFESDGDSSPFTVVMESANGVVEYASPNATGSSLSFQRGPAIDLPNGIQGRDFVFTDSESVGRYGLRLTGVTSLKTQPSAPGVAAIESHAIDRTPMSVQVSHGTAEGRTTYVAHVEDRPRVWSVETLHTTNSVFLTTQADANDGAVELAVQRGDRWLKVASTESLANITLRASPGLFNFTTSSAAPYDIQLGIVGEPAPEPLAADGLVIDLGRMTAGGRLSNIEQITVAAGSVVADAKMPSSTPIHVEIIDQVGQTQLALVEFDQANVSWGPTGEITVETTGAARIASSRTAGGSVGAVDITQMPMGRLTTTLGPTESMVTAPSGTKHVGMALNTPAGLVNLTREGAWYDFSARTLLVNLSDPSELHFNRSVGQDYRVELASVGGGALALGFADGATEARIEVGEHAENLAIDIPTVGSVSPQWETSTVGAAGRFTLAARNGNYFVEHVASDSRDPRLAITTRGEVEWDPGTSGIHDVNGRASIPTMQLQFEATSLKGPLNLTPGVDLSGGNLTGRASRLDVSVARNSPLLGASSTENDVRYVRDGGEAFSAGLSDLSTLNWDWNGGNAVISSDGKLDGSLLVTMTDGLDGFRLESPSVAELTLDANVTTDPNGVHIALAELPPAVTIIASSAGKSLNLTRNAMTPTGASSLRLDPAGADVLRFVNLSETRIDYSDVAEYMHAASQGGNTTFTRTADDFMAGSAVEPDGASAEFVWRTIPNNRYLPLAPGTTRIRIIDDSTAEIHITLIDALALNWTVSETSHAFEVDRVDGAITDASLVYLTPDVSAIAIDEAALGDGGPSCSLAPDGAGWAFSCASATLSTGAVDWEVRDTSRGIVGGFKAANTLGNTEVRASTGMKELEVATAQAGEATIRIGTPAATLRTTSATVLGSVLLSVHDEACNAPGAIFNLELENITRLVPGVLPGVAGVTKEILASGGALNFSYGHGSIQARQGELGTSSFAAECVGGVLFAAGAMPVLADSRITNAACDGAVVERYVAPTVGEPGIIIPMPFWHGYFTVDAATAELGFLDVSITCDGPSGQSGNAHPRITYALENLDGAAEPAEHMGLNFVRLPDVEGGADCGPMRIGGSCMQSLEVDVIDGPATATVHFKGVDVAEGLQVLVPSTDNAIGNLDVVIRVAADADGEESGNGAPFQLHAVGIDIDELDVMLITGEPQTMPPRPANDHYVAYTDDGSNTTMHVALDGVERLELILDADATQFSITKGQFEIMGRKLAVAWRTPCNDFDLDTRETMLAAIHDVAFIMKSADLCNSGSDCDDANAVDLSLRFRLSAPVDLRSAGDHCGSAFNVELHSLDPGVSSGSFLIDGDVGTIDLNLAGDGAQIIYANAREFNSGWVVAAAEVPSHVYIAWDLWDPDAPFVSCDTNMFGDGGWFIGNFVVRNQHDIGMSAGGTIGCEDFIFGGRSMQSMGLTLLPGWWTAIPIPYTWGLICGAPRLGIHTPVAELDLPLPLAGCI